MIRFAPVCLAMISLTACAAVPPGEPLRPMPGGECQNEPGQPYVGQKASAELGAELLRATGARVLRWVPPRTAVTMDFRADRLTVSYDDAYVIERISCG